MLTLHGVPSAACTSASYACSLPRTTKSLKVRSRAVPLPIMMDAAKRLRTMALTCEAPTSAWQGVLAGLNKFEAFLAATRAREGSDEVLATIAPLTAATALAKRLIRCERVCPYDSSARCRDAHDTRVCNSVRISGVVRLLRSVKNIMVSFFCGAMDHHVACPTLVYVDAFLSPPRT